MWMVLVAVTNDTLYYEWMAFWMLSQSVTQVWMVFLTLWQVMTFLCRCCENVSHTCVNVVVSAVGCQLCVVMCHTVVWVVLRYVVTVSYTLVWMVTYDVTCYSLVWMVLHMLWKCVKLLFEWCCVCCDVLCSRVVLHMLWKCVKLLYEWCCGAVTESHSCLNDVVVLWQCVTLLCKWCCSAVTMSHTLVWMMLWCCDSHTLVWVMLRSVTRFHALV